MRAVGGQRVSFVTKHMQSRLARVRRIVRAEKSPDAVRVEALSPIPKYLVLLLWIAQIRQVVVMLSRPRQSLQSDG